jgi:thioredoxin 1
MASSWWISGRHGADRATWWLRCWNAGEYAGRAKVAKVDVDSNQRTAMRFNVRSIPSILFFKNGQHVDTVVGAVPKATLEGKIKQHLQ